MHNFTLDINSQTQDFSHYWELCIGSCHATTALRADWQSQMERCHKELGFKYVRFHGLFNDDMSVASKPLLATQPVFCFTNIDKIFDFLLSINMKPFVELGFMPSCLASGDKTIFHYKGNTTPPRDYTRWQEFITLFINHLIERYGRSEVREWYFEIWNEPNLGGADSPFGFWSASKEEYFKLYDKTSQAVKQADKALRVGGPATSNNAWIPEFLQFCTENACPVDFVTTHHYPTDVVVGYGVEDSGNFANPLDISSPEKLKALAQKVKSGPEAMREIQEQYSVFQSHLWERVERGVLTDMAKRAKKEAGNLPLLYTEWGSLAGLPSDGAFGSSFIAKTLLDNHGIVDGYSFWSFSDIFEESAQRAEAFHGGFGLLTQHGIAKAPYRAFELMRTLGNKLYKSAYSNGTVDIWAFKKPQINAVQLLAVNHNSLLHEIQNEEIEISLDNSVKCTEVQAQRIDAQNANSLAEWEKMGSPVYITKAQELSLHAASELSNEKINFTQSGNELSFKLGIPPMGIALITVYFE